MVEINGGVLKREDITKNAMGGTELQAIEMCNRLDKGLLSKFQIIHSRVRELDFTKKRILVLHDLADDPENKHLEAGGYNKFDKLVFVSNWQMQQFIERYSIPWYKCVVMQNAIISLEKRVNHDDNKIRIIYHTTPHRGLAILASVFDGVSNLHPDLDITLDVYSSFKIYGWDERDKHYEALFEFLKNHPKINYHGTVSNEEVKKAVSNSDIFAYPSIWKETSCIALIEAMSAGLLCVHSNLGALPETAANWTNMYQYHSNERDHAKEFAVNMDAAITMLKEKQINILLENQSRYTDMFYSWDRRQVQWDYLLRTL